MPVRTPKEKVEEILMLRLQRMTAAEIAERTHVPRSTVARWIRRAGLGRLKQLAPPEPIRRYERQHPGDLLHMDIKKLGRILGLGHRITGDKTRRARGVGWEYVHVAIDDNSRLAYVEVLDDERAHSAVSFLHRAVTWFAEHGVTVRRVLTDNGSCYIANAFAASCSRLNLKHSRTRPYRPRTNGKAERFIQTLTREWAYAFAFHTSDARAQLLPLYLHFYNHHRAHSALARQPPVSRLNLNNVLRTHS